MKRLILKRLILTIAAIAMLLPILFHVFIFMALSGEGYLTVEGYRKFRNRDGQIRFELPVGYTISNLQFEGDEPYTKTVADHIAVIRVGYVYAQIRFDFKTSEHRGSVHFAYVPKYNNWNHFVFRADSNPDGSLVFQIEENGVSRDPEFYTITQTIEEIVPQETGSH